MGAYNGLSDEVFGLLSARAYDQCSDVLLAALESIQDGKSQAALVSSVGLMLAASSVQSAPDDDTAQQLSNALLEQFGALLDEARTQHSARLTQAAE